VNYALTKSNIVSGKAYRSQAGSNFLTGYTVELTHTF